MASSLIAGAGSSLEKNAARNVYYVALDMQLMRAVFDYFMRDEVRISRALHLVSESALGDGFHLEWAERDKIKPEDTYDYTRDLRAMFSCAGYWCQMFGFFAFVRPQDSAKTELELQASQNGQTPEEMAERSLEKATESIRRYLGEVDNSARPKRRRESDQETEARRLETKRVATGVQKEKLVNKSLHTGTVMLASDTRIEYVKQTVEEKKRREKTEEKAKLDLMGVLMKLKDCKPIDVDAGSFYVEVDELLQNRRVVWVPHWRNNAGTAMSRGADGKLRRVAYDENVEVFVWDGRMPTREGIIQTNFVELMRQREQLREAQDNLRDADFQAAHPMPFVQQSHAPTKVDAASLVEESIYGMALLTGDMSDNAALTNPARMNPAEFATYKRNAIESRLFEMTASSMQNRQLEKRVKEIREDVARHTKAVRGGLPVSEMQTSMFEKSGILHLPAGLQFGGLVIPTTACNVLEMEKSYNQSLSIALGVPAAYLQGESLSSITTGATTANHSENYLRSTVMKYRTDISTFFDFMYDSIFHKTDTDMLTDQLKKTYAMKNAASASRDALLQHARADMDIVNEASDLDEGISLVFNRLARIEAIEREVKRVLALPYRLRIKFVKSTIVDTESLILLNSLGAVSHTEFVNILRQNGGLEKIDDATVWKNLEENLRIAQLRTVVSSPPMVDAPAEPGAAKPKQQTIDEFPLMKRITNGAK